jgi:hypothetical protein
VCGVRGAAFEQPYDRVGYLEILRIVQRRRRHRDDVTRRQGGDSHEVDVAGDEHEFAAIDGGQSPALDELDGGRCDEVVGGLHVSDECARGRSEQHQQDRENSAAHRYSPQPRSRPRGGEHGQRQ